MQLQLSWLERLSVEQEVGGSRPPNCTSNAQRIGQRDSKTTCSEVFRRRPSSCLILRSKGFSTYR